MGDAERARELFDEGRRKTMNNGAIHVWHRALTEEEVELIYRFGQAEPTLDGPAPKRITFRQMILVFRPEIIIGLIYLALWCWAHFR